MTESTSYLLILGAIGIPLMALILFGIDMIAALFLNQSLALLWPFP